MTIGSVRVFSSDRLVVEHPVADVVVAFLDQEIGRLPGLGQAGAEPAARRLAGEGLDRLRGLADVVALVLDLLHVLLGEAVAHELPVRDRARRGRSARRRRSPSR